MIRVFRDFQYPRSFDRCYYDCISSLTADKYQCHTHVAIDSPFVEHVE